MTPVVQQAGEPTDEQRAEDQVNRFVEAVQELARAGSDGVNVHGAMSAFVGLREELVHDILVAQPWTDGDRLYRKVKGAYAGSTWKPVVTWAGDDGVTKMVGESTVIPGLLHIFALDQMEAV